MMGVSRAGYYKWKNRTPSNRDINREKMIELVKTIHEKPELMATDGLLRISG